MSRLKTPKKPKKAKPAKSLYGEPAKRFIAIALCTVSAILDVKNNKDS